MSASTIRLVGGATAFEGRVEVFLDNEWGTVCDDKWGIEEAQVVCRQLGFGEATDAPASAPYGSGAGKIWLDDLQCSGQESSLFECASSVWGEHNCNHGEDAGAVCNESSTPRPPFPPATPPLPPSIAPEPSPPPLPPPPKPPPAPLRLMRGDVGSSSPAGLLEIYINGEWGTICNDGFGDEEARVVCKQLGYTGGERAPQGTYGEGRGPIWLDDIDCSSDAETLSDCTHNGIGEHNCGHDEDVGVECNAAPPAGMIRAQRACVCAVLLHTRRMPPY